MKPYKVIGRYRPTKYRGSIIGKELTALTESLGLIPLENDEIQRNAKPIWQDYALHAEVRRTAVRGSQGTGWHQDGDTSTKDMNFALVLWSNKIPTEFRGQGGSYETFQPRPFEVVIARNLACVHRRPPEAEGKRWSFRQRVLIPQEMRLP